MSSQAVDISKMVFVIIGGLGLFLLGMKNMSEGMQAVAGQKLRRMINRVTSNRFVACGLGTLITSIIQSSSVTTVMVVGLVNAGLMTLMQAIGVILGANIGTTITSWILVLKIGKYGLPILGIAAFFYLFSKKDRIRFTASSMMGLGMVFFGLELMKEGFAPLRDMPEFIEWFSRFTPETYFGVIKCCLAGALLTSIVQSSSATIGITMGLAFTGVIDYRTAGALVLGENIGTTITALLASIGTSTNAKRAAFAHTIINVLGVMWITAIFHFYMKFIVSIIGVDPTQVVYEDNQSTYPYAMKVIAATHTGFNVINVMVFMPFLSLLSRFLVWLVPEKADETPRLTFLDIRMMDAPAIGIQQSQQEILRMSKNDRLMMDQLREIVEDPKNKRSIEEEIFKQEDNLDFIQKEIVEFIGHMMEGNISHEVSEQCRNQLRVADEFESISDYITNILKLNLKMRDNQQHMSDDAKKELLELHDQVADYLGILDRAVREDDTEILQPARTQGNAITHTMKAARTAHLARVARGEATPLKSLFYTDMLNSYRRIKDHAFNIAEVLSGEK